MDTTDSVRDRTMIVDAFTVAGGNPMRPVRVDIDALRAAMDRNGVDMAMTMSLRAVQTDAVAGNDRILEIAARDPRILPVCVVDPRDTMRQQRLLETGVARGAAAFAFFRTAGPAPVPMHSILFRRALEAAAGTGKPLIFVSRASGEISLIAEATRDLHCQKVLLAGVSYHDLGEAMAVLETFDHVYLETSWQLSPGCIDLLAQAGGSGGIDRVMYGSMAALRPMRPSLNMVADADLSAADRAKVLAGNALRFLGREPEAARVESARLEVRGLPAVPAIDVHCHFNLGPEQPSTCLGPADIQKQLERFNIERAVVSSTAAYMDDLNAGNRETMEHAERYDRLYASPVVNPHHLEDSKKWLDIAQRHPKVGHVTLNAFTTFEPFGTPAWMRLWAEVAARGLPLFYNTRSEDHLRKPAHAPGGHLAKMRSASVEEVDMFRRIGAQFPRMPVIIGHGLGLEGLELAGTCPNVYLDLCSSFPEQNVYRRAVDAVGAERILFGTDLESFSPAFTLGSLWEADLDERQQRMILRDNALRILK